MSFINLLGSDNWTDADIINRTEAMIASEFPKARIDILTRKVQGQAMGYALTEQETADLQAYQAVCYQAGAAADAARADMVLLNDVMAHERAVERLTRTPVTEPLMIAEGEIQILNPAVEHDMAERGDAQDIIDNAHEQVLALYALRHPVPDAVEEVL